jgi:hypothetical protein
LRAITDQLLEVNDTMIAALDGGDIDQFQQLVINRGSLIANLREWFDEASDEQKRAAQPVLQQLADRDQDLQARAAAARDQLGRRLTESKSGGGQAYAPAASGIFDHRA